MDFDLTDEQEELRGVLRSFFERYSPESAVRRAMEAPTGFDPVVWSLFIEQLGLTGLLVPEEYDGLGLGLVDAGVVLEEMGRRLYAAPFLGSSVIAAHVLVAAADSSADDLLAGVAEGSLTITFASAESDTEGSPAAVATTATQAADGWRVSGSKSFVLDALVADVFLVTASVAGGVGLFAIEAASADISPSETFDLTRKLATVSFDNAAARPIGELARGAELAEDALAVAAVALAAEQLGSAEQCLASAVEYANVREQFGTTIGHFQAVQHRLADMLVEIESARAAVYFALWAATERVERWQDHARVAKIVASEALSFAAAESLHLHGGNGFTWEFPEHLYFRRARSSELLFGSPAFHRERLAEALGV